MSTKRLTSLLPSVCYFVLLSPCIQSIQAQKEETSAASLSSSPVAFYSRRNAFGDVQNAASLGNAPVGLYGKNHYPTFPVPYNFPSFYGSPYAPFFFSPFFGFSNFGQPGRPQLPARPQVPVRPPIKVPQRPPIIGRPPIRPPPRPLPPARPLPPVRPPARPPVRIPPTRGPSGKPGLPGKPGVSPRLLGGLGGGGIFDSIPILGPILG